MNLEDSGEELNELENLILDKATKGGEDQLERELMARQKKLARLEKMKFNLEVKQFKEKSFSIS